MLHRFKRLIGELIQGKTARNAFQIWELDILLDIRSCSLESRRRVETLRQYQRAVERQMAQGSGPPMRLSVFLEQRALRRQRAVKSRSD